RFVRAYRYDDMPWREAQEAGLLWSPVRKPDENARDEHWLKRKSFADVQHPELGRSFRYATSKWLSTETSWQVGKRPPFIGEHSQEVFDEWKRPRAASVPARPQNSDAPRLSPHGLPFPLQGVR